MIITNNDSGEKMFVLSDTRLDDTHPFGEDRMKEMIEFLKNNECVVVGDTINHKVLVPPISAPTERN